MMEKLEMMYEGKAKQVFKTYLQEENYSYTSCSY